MRVQKSEDPVYALMLEPAFDYSRKIDPDVGDRIAAAFEER